MWNNFIFEPAVQEEMLLFFSSGVHFVQQSRMVSAVWAECIMRNISVKLF